LVSIRLSTNEGQDKAYRTLVGEKKKGLFRSRRTALSLESCSEGQLKLREPSEGQEEA
jgi:hypothetical protein